MNDYIVYSVATGKVHSVGVGSVDDVDPLVFGEDMGLLAYTGAGVSDALYVLPNGSVQQRGLFSLLVSTSQITASGLIEDECAITNIPAGTTVEWPDGQIDIVTDGEVRFAVDLPGAYILKFTAVAYLDKEITIAAIPAA